MGRRYWQEPEFIELQKQWYAKLRQEGFKDIENVFTGFVEPPFKHRSHKTELEYGSLEEYYSAARAYSYEYVFKTDVERRMWELHSEGYTFRDIADKLGEHKTTVFRRIVKIRKTMLEGDKDEQNKRTTR